MFDIGDELTIQNYKIPWLIWIQLLILFLLLALLFFFTLFPFDSQHPHLTAVTTASTSSNRFLSDDIQKPIADDHDSAPTVLTNRQHNSPQGGQILSIKGEIEPSPSMRREEIEKEDEDETSSLYNHPCNYFQLATVAFLKCFGLDDTSDRPSTGKHRRRKES
ncbi:hypothetical protein RJT34_00876 [Clitoria ternatea]|uniref:Transmembrane protein n=1 Tax=Clitoria ternatea TaxID=43366 RepID=A0AAN9KJR1_CLITE